MRSMAFSRRGSARPATWSRRRAGASSRARSLVRLDGISATRALEAVRSVLPLDDFVEDPATRMAVVGDAGAMPEICRDFAVLIARADPRAKPLAAIDRFTFYERARAAF